MDMYLGTGSLSKEMSMSNNAFLYLVGTDAKQIQLIFERYQNRCRSDAAGTDK